MALATSAVYRRRHVLFCDILGFSEAVSRGAVPAAVILTLLRRLKGLEREANRPLASNALEPGAGECPDYVVQPQATYFSDCITISVPATNVDAIWLCETAAAMQKLMVGAGFLCRGAICTGDLYHDNELLFGPAYIRSVKQEKATEFPRIAVDEDTVDHFCAAEGTYDREIIRHREAQLLIRDGSAIYIDPFHHLKFFVDRPDPPPHPDIPPEVDAWRQVIARGLGVNHPRTRAKYVWAAKEFNKRMAPEGSWVQAIETPRAKERLSERVLQWIHSKCCGR